VNYISIGIIPELDTQQVLNINIAKPENNLSRLENSFIYVMCCNFLNTFTCMYVSRQYPNTQKYARIERVILKDTL